jgi:hypothetical protein
VNPCAQEGASILFEQENGPVALHKDRLNAAAATVGLKRARF